MKFTVEKSIQIDTPLAKVRPLIEDFNYWHSWSPWTIIEPGCRIEVSGTPGEPSHCMSWEGEIIGAGTNTIAAVREDGFEYNLVFLKPWRSKAKTGFRFAEANGKTAVTWSMKSSVPFFLFFMIPTMKGLIGVDYERGLRMLKELAEKGRVAATTTNSGVVDYKGFSYVGIERTVSFGDRVTAMQKDFEKIVNDVVVKHQKAAQHWVCLYPKMNMRTMEFTYIAAVSDEQLKEIDLGPEYVWGEITNSKALEIKHNGSYEFLGNAWSMGMMYTRAKKLKTRDMPFEQYWNSPFEVAPEELKTSVFFPVKN